MKKTKEERAKDILAKHKNFEASNPIMQKLLDNCFVYAYCKGATDQEKIDKNEYFKENF